jgi:dUTP pyrophosphatase
MAKPKLKYFKMYPTVEDINFATEKSAAFDIKAFLDPKYIKAISGYSNQNTGVRQNIRLDDKGVLIYPGERVLIPTGIVFDIPNGYSLKLFPRSGKALKEGKILANCVGVIDEDYTEETMVIIYNITDKNIFIKNGEAIAQGAIEKVINVEIEKINEKPAQKTSRSGGFGSTDKK